MNEDVSPVIFQCHVSFQGGNSNHPEIEGKLWREFMRSWALVNSLHQTSSLPSFTLSQYIYIHINTSIYIYTALSFV